MLQEYMNVLLQIFSCLAIETSGHVKHRLDCLKGMHVTWFPDDVIEFTRWHARKLQVGEQPPGCFPTSNDGYSGQLADSDVMISADAIR